MIGWWRRRSADPASAEPMDPHDEVWNRACDALTDGTAGLRAADVALVHAIDLDGCIQANGVASVADHDDLEHGLAGFRYFGLDDVADLVERTAVETRRADAAGDDERAAIVEQAADDAYGDPDADRLQTAFEHAYDERPEEFADL